MPVRSPFIFLHHAILAVFIAVNVFGLFICTGLFMKMNLSAGYANGHHSFECISGSHASSAASCPMSATEHLSGWEQLFAAIVGTDPLRLLLAIAVMATAFGAQLCGLLNGRPPFSVLQARLYYQRWRKKKIHNYLISIFARGLIQPRLYA